MRESLSEIKILSDLIAAHHDEQAYKRLFNMLFHPLKKFSQSIVKSKETAEEVAGDVMISLWRNREKLPHINNVKVYAFVIAKNLSLNALKKISGQEFVSIDEIDVDLVLDVSNPERLLITAELKQKIEEAVQSLPPKCKLVFKLVKEEGLSYKEAAEVLNLSIKTVDAHLVTAIRKIAFIIKAEFNLA